MVLGPVLITEDSNKSLLSMITHCHLSLELCMQQKFLPSSIYAVHIIWSTSEKVMNVKSVMNLKSYISDILI